MIRTRAFVRLLPSVVLILTWTSPPVQAQDSLAYRVVLDPLAPSAIECSLGLPSGKGGEVELRLPRWTFGENELNRAWLGISDVSASAGSTAIAVRRRGDGFWSFKSPGGAVSVTWKARDLRSVVDVKGYFTRDAILLEAPRMLLRPSVAKGLSCTLRVDAPAKWRVHSSLAPRGEGNVYRAASYDQLADAIVFAGDAQQKVLEIGGVPHRIVVDAQGVTPAPGTERLEETLEKVLKATLVVMGPFPSERNLLLFVANAQGSLAHRDGAVIGLGRVSSPDPAALVRDGTRAIIQNWCLKRFRPAELGPFDWKKEPRTRSQWFADGAAEYLADLVLRKAGILGRTELIHHWARLILEHRNHHLAASVSPEEASWNLWGAPGDGAGGIDPTLQGRLLAMLLDFRLRAASGGKRSLPDLVRVGLERYGGERGYTGPQLQRLAGELAGQDLGSLFESCVTRPGPLPYEKILPGAGLRFSWFEWKVRDPGLRAVMSGPLLVVGPLDETSALWIAGLRPGDELRYVNQQKVKTPDDVDRVIAKLKPGQKLRLDLRHDGKHRNIRFSLEDDVTLVIPVEERGGRIFITAVPPGPLRDAKIMAGDQLEKVDKRRITRAEDVVQALRRVRKGRVLLMIKRAGKRMKIRVAAPRRTFWRGSLTEDPAAGPPAQAVRKAVLGER